MCGGSAKSRCLPSIENGERTKPDRVEAAARHGRGAAWTSASPVGRLEADAVRGAAADDQEVPVLGGGAAAVAEHVAALDLVHVEHGGGDRERAAVAEPQLGADARADVEVGVRRAQRGQLVVGQVADPDRCVGGRAPARDHVVSSRSTSARCEPLRQRQVQREPSSRRAGRLGARRRRPRAARAAVKPVPAAC